MRVKLNRVETAAVVGFRLYSQECARRADVLTAQIDALRSEREALVEGVNAHGQEVFAAIEEDQGLDQVPQKHTFTRHRDGTSTIEWPDAPKKVDQPAAVLTPFPAPQVTPEELARIAAQHPTGMPGLSAEQKAELATAEPLPPATLHPPHDGPCNPAIVDLRDPRWGAETVPEPADQPVPTT